MRSIISPVVTETVRSVLQRVGAQAVDRAVWHLGLGRQGVRLTGSSLVENSERWEAEVHGWKASIVAEAAELIAHRALSGVFDLSAGESIVLESMNIRWLPSGARASTRTASGDATRGKIILEWTLSEREEFRRQVLANLTSGAVTGLTAVGCDAEGLGVVHIELEVRASARRQLSGVKL